MKYPPKSSALLAIRLAFCAIWLTATSTFSTGIILADDVLAKAGEETAKKKKRKGRVMSDANSATKLYAMQQLPVQAMSVTAAEAASVQCRRLTKRPHPAQGYKEETPTRRQKNMKFPPLTGMARWGNESGCSSNAEGEDEKETGHGVCCWF